MKSERTGKRLICHGMNDEVIAVDEARQLAAKHPSCTLWLPANTGHMGRVQHSGLAHRVTHFYPLPDGKQPDALND